jgi:hypothetical protein
MSVLQVANVWFESTASQRIDRVGSTVNIVSPNANVSANLAVAGSANLVSATVAQMNVTGTLLQLGSSNYPIIHGTNTATTSGTTKDFTSIPSWVKRITVMFNGTSSAGATAMIVQIGTGGTPASTGYISTTSNLPNGVAPQNATGTAGFTFNASAASTFYGTMNLYLLDPSTNTWAATHVVARGDSAATMLGGGTKTLSGVLDIVRITATNGTDAFDAGSVNIMYD